MQRVTKHLANKFRYCKKITKKILMLKLQKGIKKSKNSLALPRNY